jgi:pimeloyl-ACP methyl ester carboxylesterase
VSYFVTSDKVKLSYTLQGPYGAPTIVFSTGYSGNQGTWAAQVPFFLDKGYRVLTWDYRDHGDSQTVDYGLKISRLATDLSELLGSLRLEKVILIGHSMGAMVTYSFMATHPENVVAVVTEDQPPQVLPDETWVYGRKSMTAENVEAVADAFPKTPLIAKPIEADVKRLVGKNLKPFDFKGTKPLLMDGLGQSFLDVVANEQVPHLFLAGSASPLYDAKQADAARALQPVADSQAYIFLGCGHIPHLESAGEYNQVISDFLTRVGVAPTAVS